MKYTLSLRSAAVDDMDEGRRNYHAISAELGLRFRNAVAKQLREVGKYPLRYPVIDASGTRRSLLKKFPFGIIYRVEADRVFVITVHDLRRDPSRWEGRR